MGQLQERYKSYRRPQEAMAKGIYPYFRAITGKQGTEVDMGGHKVLMFGSNAYTGLTGDQRIIDKAKAAIDKYGTGCAGSRFLNGTLDLHIQLEKEIAEFVGKEDCLCFSTGFSVNQGVIPAVLGKDDFVTVSHLKMFLEFCINKFGCNINSRIQIFHSDNRKNCTAVYFKIRIFF